ncbi:hypothetical protein BK797_05650 [Kosakonia sacchari]|nr:hypothetical protein H650_21525 [Enterobacter sp. R4-368]PDO87679.1 hypothetical protein BK797_05650 [Kosakonia sacchari]
MPGPAFILFSWVFNRFTPPGAYLRHSLLGGVSSLWGETTIVHRNVLNNSLLVAIFGFLMLIIICRILPETRVTTVTHQQALTIFEPQKTDEA